MLKPAATDILKNNESYYSLVVAVAKRAREITNDAFENKTVINERPVKMAVDEFAANEFKLIEDSAERGI
jgi:DNA-directed RNA polymerase subunit omega